MNAAIYECRIGRRSPWLPCHQPPGGCENERRIRVEGVLEFLDHIKTKLERGQELNEREQATLDEVTAYIAGVVKEFMELLEKYVIPAAVEFAKALQVHLDALYVSQQPQVRPELEIPIEINIPPVLVNPPGSATLSPWLHDRFMNRN